MVDYYGFHVGIYTEPEEEQFIHDHGSNIWKPNIVIGDVLDNQHILKSYVVANCPVLKCPQMFYPWNICTCFNLFTYIYQHKPAIQIYTFKNYIAYENHIKCSYLKMIFISRPYEIRAFYDRFAKPCFSPNKKASRRAFKVGWAPIGGVTWGPYKWGELTPISWVIAPVTYRYKAF